MCIARMQRMKKLCTERIDLFSSIRPMSHNMPGHEKRMQAHCERVQWEYHDKGGERSIPKVA